MNNCIRSILKKYDISPKRVTIVNDTKIIDDKVVIKKKKCDNLNDIYKYLKSRSFDYFPDVIDIDDEYEVYPYIKDNNEPREQKAMDLMYLLGLLHSKTTFYREIDTDKKKEVYESVIEKLDYLNNYYNDLITMIESEVYMSPASYLIARNINIIFSSIYYAKDNIESWYKMDDTKNERVVNIHNNISLDHYIKSEKPYLISWNRSKIDSPIYDLLSFYKNHYLEFDFADLFYYYENNYPLKEKERTLLFVYMAIPDKIDIDVDQYEMCIKINKMIRYLYKTSNLIMNYQKK